MKKAILLVFIGLLIGSFSVNSGYGMTAAEKDYRIIKNAVAKKSLARQNNSLSYLKVLVTDNDSKKVTVRITIPVPVIEWLSGCVDDELDINGCTVDLKKVLKDLKHNGPLTLIEIYREDKTLKIWFE